MAMAFVGVAVVMILLLGVWDVVVVVSFNFIWVLTNKNYCNFDFSFISLARVSSSPIHFFWWHLLAFAHGFDSSSSFSRFEFFHHVLSIIWTIFLCVNRQIDYLTIWGKSYSSGTAQWWRECFGSTMNLVFGFCWTAHCSCHILHSILFVLPRYQNSSHLLGTSEISYTKKTTAHTHTHTHTEKSNTEMTLNKLKNENKSLQQNNALHPSTANVQTPNFCWKFVIRHSFESEHSQFDIKLVLFHSCLVFSCHSLAHPFWVLSKSLKSSL